MRDREIIWWHGVHRNYDDYYLFRGNMEDILNYARVGWSLRPATMDDMQNMNNVGRMMIINRKVEER